VPTTLTLSCGVGDGMMVVFRRNTGIHKDAISAHPLMSPDTGEYSGQTQFVDVSTTASENLRPRIRLHFLGRPEDVVAIAAMTDGVADDYYEKTGMGRLYCDLLLNGILPTEFNRPSRSSAGWPSDSFGIVAEETILEQPNASGQPRTRPIKYVGKYLETNGLTPTELVQQPGVFTGLLHSMPDLTSTWAGSSAEDLAAKLRDWLDSYIAPANFDDRAISMFIRREGQGKRK